MEERAFEGWVRETESGDLERLRATHCAVWSEADTRGSVCSVQPYPERDPLPWGSPWVDAA